jgi:hypothetical protein
MAYKWLCKLKEKYPHLAQRAEFLNRRDCFIMKYDPNRNEEDSKLKKKGK